MARPLLAIAATLLLPVATAAAADAPLTGLPGYADVVVRDNGAASVVGGGAGPRRLFAGPVGGAATKLADCKPEFDDDEQPPPVVSGATVAWLPCPNPGRAASVDVFDPSGRRTVATAKDSQVPDIALAGRTLAVAETTGDDAVLRLIDLDSGAERRLAVPGEGAIVELDGQVDGTIVTIRSEPDGEETDACGTIVTAVAGPGATALTSVPAIDCSRLVLVAGGRLAYLEEDTRRLRLSALDGAAARTLDRRLDDSAGPALSTDGTTLRWTHRGCRGDEEVAVPVATTTEDRSERCPVRIRSARRSGARLRVTVACPNGCRYASVAVGFGTPRRIGLRRPGTRTLRLPLQRTDRDKRRLRLTLNGGPGQTAFAYRRPLVRAR